MVFMNFQEQSLVPGCLKSSIGGLFRRIKGNHINFKMGQCPLQVTDGTINNVEIEMIIWPSPLL
jgi:hypothetical protein